MAEVARILDRDDDRRGLGGPRRVHVGASHSCTSWNGPKASASRRVEQVAEVLRAATSGGVDDDRRGAGHRPHHASGEPSCVVGEAGVHVQRAAAVAAPSGQRDAVSRAAEHPNDRGVHGPLPRVHDASGEQPHVIASALERRESKGQLRDSEARRDALRNEMGPLATASTRDPANTRP